MSITCANDYGHAFLGVGVAYQLDVLSESLESLNAHCDMDKETKGRVFPCLALLSTR